MFSSNCTSRSRRRDAHRTLRTTMTSSGNAAFDAYKADTLRRLEDEQQSFEDFLRRLREAKDKTEFDDFMNDRARRTTDDADLEDMDETGATDAKRT